ncbi:LOW QUALITY PROTEIN: protein ECERIFERUM 26-like [Phalaenopsis equestris]|uniref:LOW QUALITY PROTEIN: protein ECERIFERUM 26-like n=1 Tax=Phalaenopsis equestris TaxID=78828 RepID=UPI0009E1D0E4|nr:LOW QUALITY PROTEIN: protein ECERIFERUM 26-like [Phalaenopsis equestris]
MVSSNLSDAIHSIRLSTVVPGDVTPANTVHHLTGGDLALKLHYLKSVYYFRPSDVLMGLTIPSLKKPMFPLLNIYYPAAGRIRRDETGRPHIKCNDGGVRIVEACCDLTMEEWLDRKEVDRNRRLFPDKAGGVGPDIYFSPTVFIQFTRFKCGGMAIGFSWAHLLGDAVSASNFINLWGQLLSGKEIPKNFQLHNLKNDPEKSIPAELDSVLPSSVEQVKQVGDFWLNSNTQRMATFSIELTATKLNYLQSKISTKISIFQTIASLLWQNIAKIRAEKEPKLVTVCSNSSIESNGILSNQIKVKTVASNSSPAKTELLELAKLLNKEAIDEMKSVQDLLNRETEKLDVILYGSNLTFVDMESINFYKLELKGQQPVHVEYNIDGVGDEGAVLVLQGHVGTSGRVISLILPEEEILQLRELLENDWGIA